MKEVVSIISLAVLVPLLLTALPVYAANVADVTSSYRVCLMRYVKISYDAGPWSALVTQKIGDRSSVSIWNWHSADDSQECVEGVISARLARGVEIGLVQDQWRGAEDNAFVMTDISSGRNGLGLLLPVGKAGGEMQIGPRIDLGSGLAGFASLRKGQKPYLGLGCYRGVSLDLTVGANDSWWFRASRPFPHGNEIFVPELRLRKSEGEMHLGFGLGYAY